MNGARANASRATAPGRAPGRARTRAWGGAREGAGRPARGPIPSEPHKMRPHLAGRRHPVHVIARVEPGARSPRGVTYRSLRRALRLALARADFRIVRIAVLRDRLELVVEADDAVALARGMQGFQVSAARSLNRTARRQGCVFADRYRMRILTSREAVRETLGRLPIAAAARTNAWPATYMLRIELAARALPRRWLHARADDG